MLPSTFVFSVWLLLFLVQQCALVLGPIIPRFTMAVSENDRIPLARKNYYPSLNSGTYFWTQTQTNLVPSKTYYNSLICTLWLGWAFSDDQVRPKTHWNMLGATLRATTPCSTSHTCPSRCGCEQKETSAASPRIRSGQNWLYQLIGGTCHI